LLDSVLVPQSCVNEYKITVHAKLLAVDRTDWNTPNKR